MAEMLPTAPSANTQSDAELRLFRRFRADGPDTWTVLHSLGLKNHRYKPWAEADFVVLTARGIFVVEVKGGAVRREGRRWYTYDTTLVESPFDQASGAAAALFHELRAHVPAINNGVVGAAVAFPDVEFDRNGPDIVPELVYDASDAGRPLQDWLERVADYWTTRLDRPGAPARRGLSRAVRQDVVRHLAADFDLRPSLRARLGEVEAELMRFTDQQCTVMNALSENPRMIVNGGAGTGKTWLAVEEALRAAESGRSVLLICHTKALAGWLRDHVPAGSGIRVEHFHGLTTDLIRRAGLQHRFSDATVDHRFRIEHPELALEALAAIDDPPCVDTLIVDETQDILTVPAVHFLDALVRGGLRHGTWRLFLDPRQDVLGAMDVAAFDELTKGRPTRLQLNVNCRNTAEIATQTAVTACRDIDDFLPVSGPEVEYLHYVDDGDLRRQVGRILTGWLKHGVQPAQIVLLGMGARERSALADGLPAGVPAKLVDEIRLDRTDGRSIRYATVAGFKGLEAEAVVLLDVGRLPPDETSTAVYVAMSRAKTLLAVGMSATLAEAHATMFAEFGARLARLRPRHMEQAG
jgi:ATP:corrinoid adenosyltransferase